MKYAPLLTITAILAFSAAYMIANRYQAVSAGDSGRLWLVDSWTGTALFCNQTETRRDCESMSMTARPPAQTQVQSTTSHQELQRLYPRWEHDVSTPEFKAWLDSQHASISALMDSEDLSDALRLLGLYYSSPSYSGR